MLIGKTGDSSGALKYYNGMGRAGGELFPPSQSGYNPVGPAKGDAGEASQTPGWNTKQSDFSPTGSITGPP